MDNINPGKYKIGTKPSLWVWINVSLSESSKLIPANYILDQIAKQTFCSHYTRTPGPIATEQSEGD